MSSRYEYYITGDDGQATFLNTTTYTAQTFTPTVSHTITSVKLLLYKLNTPGLVYASIRATDVNGHPTGADLCAGTSDASTLPDGSPYEWREITLGAGYKLTAGVKYAIVVHADAFSSDRVYWRLDATDPGYTSGNYETSADSGVTWAGNTNIDFMFSEWGLALGGNYKPGLAAQLVAAGAI